MRKCVAIILVLLSVLGMYAIGQAKPLYEQYWEPGAYTVEITEEDQVRLAALREQVEMLSAGTKVREASDAETLENGGALKTNHMYTVTVQGRQIRVSQSCTLLISGDYTVQ